MTELLQQIAAIMTILAATFGIVVIFMVYRALVSEKLIPKLTALGGDQEKKRAHITPRERAKANLRRLNGGDGG